MRPFKSLRSLLVHPKDKPRQEDVCECVYKIPCRNCNKTYIGETGRAFGVRLQEHRQEVSQRDVKAYTRSTSRSLASEQSKSAVTDHAITLNHVIDWDQAKVVDRESNRMDWLDQRSDTYQKGTRQVDEQRRGVLSTFPHLWQAVRRDTWRRTEVIKTIPKKATAVAETSTIKLKVVIRWSFFSNYTIHVDRPTLQLNDVSQNNMKFCLTIQQSASLSSLSNMKTQGSNSASECLLML